MRKICIVAATLILPVLALAQTQTSNIIRPIPVPPPCVPEVNAGWALLPIAGAIILLSWRQLARRKA
jgi:hypothetical protein